jgi:hypothetical protein
MAIKDWKKIDIGTGETARFRNNKKKVDLVIIKLFFFGAKNNPRYEVYLYGSHLNNFGEETLQHLRSRQQAFSFIKSYMRTH